MFHLYCFVFLDHFMKRKKIPHGGNISKKYHTVETFQKNTTRSKHFKKIPHGRNISKKYHTVETFQKNTTRWKHFKKIPHGGNI